MTTWSPNTSMSNDSIHVPWYLWQTIDKCVYVCVTAVERKRVNSFTHHIDGWHRPDAVDIYAHIDDSWFHCKSQKEEQWVIIAAHIVGGTSVRFIHAFILFCHLSVFSSCCRVRLNLHVCPWPKIKSIIKFRTRLIIIIQCHLDNQNQSIFLFDEGRATHPSREERFTFRNLERAPPCFLEQLLCYHGN